jgi:hypothetical protein
VKRARSVSLDKHQLRPRFLKDALPVADLFSASVEVARFDFGNRTYFIAAGLDSPEVPDTLEVGDSDRGFSTEFLSELRPTPSVLPSLVRNVLVVADKTSTGGYRGRSFLHLKSYLEIRVFSVEGFLREEWFKIF